MANVTFNAKAGETIGRELLVALLNTGTSDAPVWSPVGRRVNDSTAEYDWQNETEKDIVGNTYTTKKKPIITQTFDPWSLSGGDAAQQKIYQLAVVEQNAQALSNMDMLIAHYYTKEGETTASFAERYDGCSIDVTGIGGEGGGNIAMPIEVVYGGNRTIGTVTKDESGVVTFTPEVSV